MCIYIYLYLFFSIIIIYIYIIKMTRRVSRKKRVSKHRNSRRKVSRKKRVSKHRNSRRKVSKRRSRRREQMGGRPDDNAVREKWAREQQLRRQQDTAANRTLPTKDEYTGLRSDNSLPFLRKT